MNTRNPLVAVTAVLLLTTFAGLVSVIPAAAAEPTLIVAPAYALEEFDLTYAAITPSDADLRRVKNELRFEQRNELTVTMARDFRAALDDVKIVAD